jgi:hypothetical protein
MKNLNIKIDLPSLVEFQLTENERIELVNHILYSTISDKALKQFTKKFISGIEEVEHEDKKRVEVIKACETLRKKL